MFHIRLKLEPAMLSSGMLTIIPSEPNSLEVLKVCSFLSLSLSLSLFFFFFFLLGFVLSNSKWVSVFMNNSFAVLSWKDLFT